MIILACLISLVGFVLGQTNVTNSTNSTCFNTCEFNSYCSNEGGGLQCHIYIDLCGKHFATPLNNVTYKTPGNHYSQWITDHCPLDNVKFWNFFLFAFDLNLSSLKIRNLVVCCQKKKTVHPNTNTHTHTHVLYKYSAHKVDGTGRMISVVNT